jgi:signal transduction histidine kinase
MVNLLLLLVIVGAAFLVESRQRIAIVQEVEKRALVMAQALVSTTTSDLLTYNYVSIEQTVQQFGKKPDLVYAVVTDKEGNVAAQFVRNYPLTQLLDKGPARKNGGPAGQQLRLPGGEHDVVYDVRLPVMVEGSPDPWGEIRLGVSLKAMYEEIDRTRWQIAGFGVMALALGGLGATLLAERMTRPIKPLMTAVAAVGRGEFDHRIGVASQDELGRLSAAFNDMSVQLGRVRELEERLRRADRLAALGTMAAGIAHDIRNPLTSILIFSQLMSLHHDDPEVREKFDRVVPRELERVQAVIEDMMELARPSSITLEPANMNEVIAQVLELFESQVATHKIAVRRDFQRDLPFGMMDRKRMHRCLSNLISNAIQAMPGGGELAVQTRHVQMAFPASRPPGTKPEQAIRVTVSDTGQGIPADRLSRIFDPFYTTKEKGVGLGMAITHRIVEDHKGTIDVASEVSKGSAFTLHFPVSA